MDKVFTEMSARDANAQIAIAASNLVVAAAGSEGVSIEYLIKVFDQAFDHILEKTRPIG